MRLEDLDYDLPPDRIAQHPSDRREDARLLVVERAGGLLHDARFRDLPRWLRRGDALAVNETRVIPARLHVWRRPTGGRIELLFVRRAPDGDHRETWHVLARPARNARPGAILESADRALALEVVGVEEQGARLVRVVRGDLARTLEEEGQVPLPPYIERAPTPLDRERYQTVYARVAGAVAAPTAGLHFSQALLAEIEGLGVALARVLLHVGPGTFRPVTVADVREHRMEAEYFEVGEEAVRTLRQAREAGGRVIAVGTTVVRALESACDAHAGRLGPASGWTSKFIHPPYEFRAVDALLTNFHLPRTTLLLLVAAFAGAERVRSAYRHAVAEGYRFYSYGDAMLIV